MNETAFPSLGEAIKQPAKSTKKGKGTKLNLADFNAFPVGRSRQPSDKELLMQLPKSSSGLPKEERGASGLGGGFKEYGGNRQGGECCDCWVLQPTVAPLCSPCMACTG